MDKHIYSQQERNSRGLTLLEVVVVVAIVALATAALTLAMTSSFASTRDSAEREAAMRAARLKLEELASMPFVPLIPAYGESASESAREFEVPLELSTTFNSKTGTGRIINLQGWADRPAGEVIVIHRENADPTKLGRNLDGVAGGDGVRFRGLPMDLNGDGDSTDGLLSPQALVRIPIGVVVRWVGMNGREERYELWTIRSAY